MSLLLDVLTHPVVSGSALLLGGMTAAGWLVRRRDHNRTRITALAALTPDAGIDPGPVAEHAWLTPGDEDEFEAIVNQMLADEQRRMWPRVRRAMRQLTGGAR